MLADFEKVIATVALIFRCNPRSRFVTTYQLRRCGKDAIIVAAFPLTSNSPSASPAAVSAARSRRY